MGRMWLVGVVLASLTLTGGVAAGAEGAPSRGEGAPAWSARVGQPVGRLPGRPRRAMIAFPLTEAGAEDGTVGAGGGLIALQAMWLSSFAPDRLLEEHDEPQGL